MKVFRGYRIKGRKGLSHWNPIFEEWILSIERYCRIMKGEDAPYWYNERANIGLLAGASWRCGRIALEEFQKDKGYKNAKKKNGRSDLWIASEDHEELIEAKFKWLSLKNKDPSKLIKKTIDIAVDDTKKARGNDTDTMGIAVGFFPVYIGEKNIGEVDRYISEFIEEVLSADYHAIGWSFPAETRNYLSSKKELLPGVIMIIRNIDHQ